MLPRTSISTFKNEFLSREKAEKISFSFPSAFSISEMKICSTETNSSFILSAIFSAEMRILSASGEIYASPLLLAEPEILGIAEIRFKTDVVIAESSMFIFLKSPPIRPFSCIKSA